jgi:hypothetical protein
MRGLARPSAPNPIIIPNSKRSESAAADHLRRLIGNKIRPTSFHNQASGWVDTNADKTIRLAPNHLQVLGFVFSSDE